MTGRTKYRDLLRNRNYALVWLGQVTSQLGDAFYEIALVWLVLEMTGGSFSDVGLVIFARLAPYVLVGPLAGVLVDRLDRRRVMIVADMGRAAVLLLVPTLHLLDALAVWHVAVVAFLLTALRTFFNPALQASIPQVVGKNELINANAVMQASLQAATVVGPAVAGLILLVASPQVLFLVDAATFAVSALTIVFVSLVAVPREPAGIGVSLVLADLAAATRAVAANREVCWTIVMFAVGLLTVAGTYRVGMPALAEQVYHGGPQTFGLLMSALGLGTVIGALVAGKLNVQRVATAVFAGWMLWGACFALLGYGRVLAIALVLAVLAGVAESAVTVFTVSLVQRNIPEGNLGKVFSLWSMLNSTGESASGVLVGAALGSVRAPVVFAVSGLATIGVGVAGLLAVRRAPAAYSRPVPQLPSPQGEDVTSRQ
jgi:MFS transporter, DHA3 family, macrolide efflux protein